LCDRKIILIDASSSDDDEEEEITWTCLQRSQKKIHDNSVSKKVKTVEEEDEEESEGRKTPVRAEMKSPNASKPPRGPPGGNSSNITSASLDRRQRSRSQSHRRERDSKSRSTHSLKENDEKILIGNNLQAKDNNSSSSCSNRRMSPITWEAPPPPPFYPYDKWEQHYYKHQMTSRDDLRSMEYYRRPMDPFRIGSCQELFHHPSQLSLTGNCESPYFHFPPPPSCCNNHFYPPYQQVIRNDPKILKLSYSLKIKGRTIIQKFPVCVKNLNIFKNKILISYSAKTAHPIEFVVFNQTRTLFSFKFKS
jgi:hypothetical protein